MKYCRIECRPLGRYTRLNKAGRHSALEVIGRVACDRRAVLGECVLGIYETFLALLLPCLVRSRWLSRYHRLCGTKSTTLPVFPKQEVSSYSGAIPVLPLNLVRLMRASLASADDPLRPNPFSGYSSQSKPVSCRYDPPLRGAPIPTDID
jgi:hypothetical protein